MCEYHPWISEPAPCSLCQEELERERFFKEEYECEQECESDE